MCAPRASRRRRFRTLAAITGLVVKFSDAASADRNGAPRNDVGCWGTCRQTALVSAAKPVAVAFIVQVRSRGGIKPNRQGAMSR